MRDVTVSVLMPAYNAARYVRQSVESVLAQTFEDFELIVVDDGSTDSTAHLLEEFADPRLRVVRNPSRLGLIGALNRAMEEARGRYIARIDSDDIAQPCRFARQVAFLERNPQVALVATRMRDFEGGRPRPSRRISEPDPAVLRWLFHISNPVGHPSMMFRAETVARMGVYLRRDSPDAEDFEFSHRVLRHGEVAVLPEALMLYRLHTTNATRTRQSQMVARTGHVLAEAYRDLLGRPGEAEGMLVATHLVAGAPVPDEATLSELGRTIDLLLDAFLARHPLDAAQRALCERYAAMVWWRAAEQGLRTGLLRGVAVARASFPRARLAQPAWARIARSALIGIVPGKPVLARAAQRMQRAWIGTAHSPARFNVGGSAFETLPLGSDDPPRLTVVVDTEAEFDWGKPFGRSLISVRSVAAQERAQAICDMHGVRPIYLVDYAVAAQTEGSDPLRHILARHACAIGAHLHPWINPPHEEALTERNSYGGNLPPELEAAKLERLVAAIERSFGVRPLFFKAGRYGLGPHTMAALAQLGFAVDFSILPGADFRARGGADFRGAGIDPCRSAREGLLSLPMTRAQIGLMAPLPRPLDDALRSRWAQRLRLPGMLSRLHLANTVTLTPEGVTAEEQIALLRLLVAQGHRHFVLHYHSPSLAPGNTPYVRSEADLNTFLDCIQRVFDFFFGELGGHPAHPADLLPPDLRPALWPARGALLSTPSPSRSDGASVGDYKNIGNFSH